MATKSNEINNLIADLIYLRKGMGFVAARVYEVSSFLSVIGRKDQIFESIKTRFISAIHSLPTNKMQRPCWLLTVCYRTLNPYLPSKSAVVGTAGRSGESTTRWPTGRRGNQRAGDQVADCLLLRRAVARTIVRAARRLSCGIHLRRNADQRLPIRDA